jgi:hypothetical protein
MREHAQIDHVHCHAICSEIGERLKIVLRQGSLELPQNIQDQLDQLRSLDEAASPSIVPSMNQDLRS